VALLAACLYAAFAHGAVASANEERLQLVIAVIALAAAAWSRRGLSLRAPRRAAPRLGVARPVGRVRVLERRHRPVERRPGPHLD
jgi:hypothetical protein